MDDDTYTTMPPADEPLLKEELSEEVGSEYVGDLSAFSPFRVDAKKLSSNEADWQDFLVKVNVSPEKVKDILVGVETIELLADFSENFGLAEDQSQELTRILRDLLLADLFWGDLPKTISARLQVDPDTANQIVKKLTDELLAPALGDIKKMQMEKFKDRISQSTSGQVQQPPTSGNVGQSNIINLRNRNNQ